MTEKTKLAIKKLHLRSMVEYGKQFHQLRNRDKEFNIWDSLTANEKKSISNSKPTGKVEYFKLTKYEKAFLKKKGKVVKRWQ